MDLIFGLRTHTDNHQYLLHHPSNHDDEMTDGPPSRWKCKYFQGKNSQSGRFLTDNMETHTHTHRMLLMVKVMAERLEGLCPPLLISWLTWHEYTFINFRTLFSTFSGPFSVLVLVYRCQVNSSFMKVNPWSDLVWSFNGQRVESWRFLEEKEEK